MTKSDTTAPAKGIETNKKAHTSREESGRRTKKVGQWAVEETAGQRGRSFIGAKTGAKGARAQQGDDQPRGANPTRHTAQERRRHRKARNRRRNGHHVAAKRARMAAPRSSSAKRSRKTGHTTDGRPPWARNGECAQRRNKLRGRSEGEKEAGAGANHKGSEQARMRAHKEKAPGKNAVRDHRRKEKCRVPGAKGREGSATAGRSKSRGAKKSRAQPAGGQRGQPAKVEPLGKSNKGYKGLKQGRGDQLGKRGHATSGIGITDARAANENHERQTRGSQQRNAAPEWR